MNTDCTTYMCCSYTSSFSVGLRHDYTNFKLHLIFLPPQLELIPSCSYGYGVNLKFYSRHPRLQAIHNTSWCVGKLDCSQGMGFQSVVWGQVRLQSGNEISIGCLGPRAFVQLILLVIIMQQYGIRSEAVRASLTGKTALDDVGFVS